MITLYFTDGLLRAYEQEMRHPPNGLWVEVLVSSAANLHHKKAERLGRMRTCQPIGGSTPPAYF
jgi:hypothetical protein